MDKCSQIEMHRKENSMRRCGPIISALNSLRPPEIWVQATQRYWNGLQEIIYAKESGFRNLGKFCRWNPEPWALKSRIQLKEPRNPIDVIDDGGRNPSSTDKEPE